MSKKMDTAVIGNIGLFYVCYKLSEMGFIVTPTSRNTQAIDLFVANIASGKSFTVQVKYRSGLGGDGETLGNTEKEARAKAKRADFWVFVRRQKDDTQNLQVFVCRGDDKILIHQVKKYWGLYPFRGEQKRPEVFAKWQKQKGDKGWKLIERALK